MNQLDDKRGPAWLSVSLVRERLLIYLSLLHWADDRPEIDLHFMVGLGDRLWNSLGSPPNMGRKQGVLAYAVVTLSAKETEEGLNRMAHHILQTLSSDYLTTLSQLGDTWNEEAKDSANPND